MVITMPQTTLVSTEWLEARLADSTVLIVDCRFSLDDPGWGSDEYSTRHIPGAVYASLDRDLSGPKVEQTAAILCPIRSLWPGRSAGWASPPASRLSPTIRIRDVRKPLVVAASLARP